MPRRKTKIRYEDTAEYKKDVVHEIQFLKGDMEYPWVKLWGDPKEDPEIIQQAIKQFQEENGVSDWKEKADRYKTRSYWFG